MLSNKTINIIFLLPFLFIITKSQLTLQDKNIIENYILQGQSKNTGLFFEEGDNLKYTKEAISVLKLLGLQVKYSKDICKKISEKKEKDYNFITIDNLLGCKNDYKSYKPDFQKQKLVELYHESLIMEILNINNWDKIFKNIKDFMVSDNGKFSLFEKTQGKKTTKLATALGIEIMSFVVEKNSTLKKEALPLIQKSVDSLLKSYAILNDDMIVFLEKNKETYKLNYHIIKALKAAKKVGVDIPSLNNYLYQLLNYFNTFKYEMITNIDNTFYLLNIYKLLEKIPLINISNENFDYLKEKNIKINFQNIFGEKLKVKNTTLEIKINENKERNPKIRDKTNQKKSSSLSYDLEDDIDDTKIESNLGEAKKEIKIKESKSEIELDLSKMIKGPGFFTLSISMYNAQYKLNEHITKNLRSFAEVEITSIDFEIIDKIHEENNQRFTKISYPEKFSSKMKANQDCSLIARVKISFPGGKKPTLMEQVFLRLRHKELNKSYNAYASKYDKETNEYFINFELDDPVTMESFNGDYDMSIIMSDPIIKNIIRWDFGDIKISFTKPTDPLDEQKALKNNLQPKMEPTFSPEVKREKNMGIALIFSGFIIILTFLLFVILIKSDSNINNFPKSSFSFLMNILFIGVLGTVAYILFLFWTKYNILQTMFIFVVICIPASFIVYKALKNHKIEIVSDNVDE